MNDKEKLKNKILDEYAKLFRNLDTKRDFSSWNQYVEWLDSNSYYGEFIGFDESDMEKVVGVAIDYLTHKERKGGSLKDDEIIQLSNNLVKDIKTDHFNKVHKKKHGSKYQPFWEDCSCCWARFVTEIYKAGHRAGYGSNKCSKHGWVNIHCPSCLNEVK